MKNHAPSRGRLLLLALALFASVLSLDSGAGALQDDQPEQVVIFVIDLSGSMNESFGGGQSKLDVAKVAFEEAFQRVSPDAMVGLRVYGNQFPATSPDNREENCTQDSELLIAIDQVDRESLIDEVRGFSASGDTPIGLALRGANEDIPDGSVGTIVLFSDGRDECFDADLDGDAAVGPSWGEDPCVVAADIAGEGTELKIEKVETVGFGADDAAELELRCIADVSGGSYTDIKTPEDARDLLPALLATIGSPRIAERLGGTPIVGAADLAGAPDFTRLDAGSGDGRYVDSIEMNTEKWYRMDDFGPDGGTFTATVFGLPAQEGIELSLRAYLPETDQTFFESRSDNDAGLPRRPTASVRCPGCFVSGGPHDIYWIVSLDTENPALGGVYDLELLTEGPGFGGSDSNCREPQECWYDSELEIKQGVLEDLNVTYDDAALDAVDAELIAERDDLRDELGIIETAAGDKTSQLVSLRDQSEIERTAPSNFSLPAMLGGLGLLALLGSFFIRKKPGEPALAGAGAAAGAGGLATPSMPGTPTPNTPSPSVPAADVPSGPAAPGTPSPPPSPAAAPPWASETEDPHDLDTPAVDDADPGTPAAPTLDPDATTVVSDPILPPVAAADTVEPPEVADLPDIPDIPDAPDASADLPETADFPETAVLPETELPATQQMPATDAGAGIKEGWYADPSDPTQYRWWDGNGWTSHTQRSEG